MAMAAPVGCNWLLGGETMYILVDPVHSSELAEHSIAGCRTETEAKDSDMKGPTLLLLWLCLCMAAELVPCADGQSSGVTPHRVYTVGNQYGWRRPPADYPGLLQHWATRYEILFVRNVILRFDNHGDNVTVALVHNPANPTDPCDTTPLSVFDSNTYTSLPMDITVPVCGTYRALSTIPGDCEAGLHMDFVVRCFPGEPVPSPAVPLAPPPFPLPPQQPAPEPAPELALEPASSPSDEPPDSEGEEAAPAPAPLSGGAIGVREAGALYAVLVNVIALGLSLLLV